MEEQCGKISEHKVKIIPQTWTWRQRCGLTYWNG